MFWEILAKLVFIKKNKRGIFNAGFENLSILQIAKNISKRIKSKIKIKKNMSDNRSYNLDSSKLLKAGYKPKKNINMAIDEIKKMTAKGDIIITMGAGNITKQNEPLKNILL